MIQINNAILLEYGALPVFIQAFVREASKKNESSEKKIWSVGVFCSLIYNMILCHSYDTYAHQRAEVVRHIGSAH